MQATRWATIDRADWCFFALLAATIWLRIAGLQASTLDLHMDEAQYWAWSRAPDWGYFSKPPLVAWAIGATTALFGDSEWAVRLSAPLAHGIGAAALFALGRSLYGPWAGFWAGAGWLMLPAVWLSSGVASTDALLLPLWSVGLFALWRLVATRAWAWAVVLGLAMGFGALAKYAMLYFPICTGLAAWWARPVRAVMFSRRGAVAFAIALVVLAPNLYWNFTHGFATVAHTAANARFTANLFHPDEVFEFIGSQAWVLGPVLFIALAVLLWRAAQRRAGLATEDLFLIAFIAPPLAVILLEALLSRANPNWAATAYPAALVWVSGALFSDRVGRRVLAAGLALNIALGAVIAAAAVSPEFAEHVPGGANGLKRVRAWEATAQEIAIRAVTAPGETPFTALLVDDRETYYELAYYWRHARRSGEPLPPVRMWRLHAEPHNHAEATDPMREEEGARVLVVHANPRYLPVLAADFTVFRPVEHLSIPLGGGKTRNYEISVGEGFAPAPRDAAFEERLPQ
jgi:4-amino-4-deoxy-L-arabinose transferase-like glycosyltransferase